MSDINGHITRLFSTIFLLFFDYSSFYWFCTLLLHFLKPLPSFLPFHSLLFLTLMYLFFYPFIFLLFSFYFDSSYPHYLTINFIFPLILYIFSHTKKGYYSLSLSLSLSLSYFFFCGFFNFLYLYFMLSNFVFCRTLVDKIWVCVFKLFFFFFSLLYSI